MILKAYQVFGSYKRENTKFRDSVVDYAVFRTITVLYCYGELGIFYIQTRLDGPYSTQIMTEQF